MDRRRFLALCGAGAGFLAGCATDSQRKRTDPSPGAASGDTSQRSPGPPLEGAWDSYQHDAANTGAAADPGPVAEPVERWRQTTATGSPATGPAAASGAFVVATRTGVLYARDAVDGSVRWSRPATDDPVVATVLTGDAVVVAGGRTLLGVGVETGAERWSLSVEDAVLGLAPGTRGVAVATASSVRSVAPDGRTRWRRRPSERVVTPPGAAGDSVAVGLASGGALALDAGTGRVRWDAPLPAEPTFAPAVDSDRVYLDAGYRVVALDRDDGDPEWRVETEFPFAASPVATADAVYVVTLDENADPASETPHADADRTRTPAARDTLWFDADVFALDPADGSERWHVEVTETYNFTSGPPGRLPLVAADGRLLVGLGGRLRAYDAGTGDAVWSANAGGVAPAVTDGVVSTGPVGLALDDGAVRWRFGASDGVSPAAVVGNTLYVGSDDTYLYALAANAGTVEWSARADGAVRATPAVGDDAVYVGTLEGTLHAVERGDGTERWSYDVGGQVEAPALADGTVYVGNFSPAITAVDADDGTLEWRTEVPRDEAGRFLARRLAVADGAVYAGANGDFRAFEAADGTERWRVAVGERPAVQSPPVVGADAVFLSLGDSLRAFAPADGTERWARSTGGSTHPPVVRDGTVFASGGDAVYAFDATGGRERWRTPVGDELLLAAGPDALYGLGYDAPLRALDPDDGSELWRRGDAGATTPPAIAGGFLFVGDGAGAIRALGTGRE